MASTTRKQIYNRAYLEKLSTEPNSCVSLVESERKLELHPVYLNDPKSGVWDLLYKSLKKFDRSLNGILMGYKNIQIIQDKDTGKIKGRCGEFEALVKLQFYIFQPRIGSYLEGIVNKKSRNHIGCLVHTYFNAVILKPELTEYEDWVCQELDINDKVVFKVMELDFSGVLPRIVGDVDSDFIKGKDNKKKNKKRTKEEKNDSLSELDESFLQIVQTGKETPAENKEDVKSARKEKKHKKKGSELPCNSTQRFSATGKELEDADFDFLSPVVPPLLKTKKKKEKRNSDEVDKVITSTQIPATNKDADSSDFSTLSPIEKVDGLLKRKKEKKKKKEKEKKRSDEKNVPITSTQLPVQNQGETNDFYIFSPIAKIDEKSINTEKKKKKKEKNEKKSDTADQTSSSSQVIVKNKQTESNDSSAFSSTEAVGELAKSKKKKKKDKDKNHRGESDKNQFDSKSKNESTECEKLEINSIQKEKKNDEKEEPVDPLEKFLELEMQKYKKPLLNEKDEKSDTDEDIFIPATQILPNEKSLNLPEILSRSSYGKTDSDQNSQKTLKDSGSSQSKLDTVNLKSPLKLKSPKKRKPSDCDSVSSSSAKKPKLEKIKNSFKNKLELINHKPSTQKMEPPKKLFSPEKHLLSDSDTSVKKSPKKMPEVQNLLIDDLLKEQKLTMLGREDVKKDKVLVAVKNLSENKKDKVKQHKRSKSEKILTPTTSKLMDEILQEAKKSLLVEEKSKKEKSKSAKEDVVNGTINNNRLLKRESSESASSMSSAKEKKKKTSSKKEKEVKKSEKTGSNASGFNSAKSKDLEIQKLLAMALKDINYPVKSKKKKNISI